MRQTEAELSKSASIPSRHSVQGLSLDGKNVSFEDAVEPSGIYFTRH